MRPLASVTRYFPSTSVKQFLSFGFVSGYLLSSQSGALPAMLFPTATTGGRAHQRLTTAR